MDLSTTSTDAGGFRSDFDWLLARAEYLFPDADDHDAKMFARIQAAVRMRAIEKAYEDDAHQ